MYRKFYDLKEKPFEITVDPRYFYLSETHKEALANLIYAVQEKKAFAVITGEAGTGKTTLVQVFLSRLNPKAKTAFLFNPKVDSNSDFLYSICEDLELAGQKGSKVDYLIRLNAYLTECFSKKEDVLIIIDEAHTLGPELLEEVRLLTNLENMKVALFTNDWGTIAMLMSQIAMKLNKIQIAENHRLGKPWVGVYKRMLSEQ